MTESRAESADSNALAKSLLFVGLVACGMLALDIAALLFIRETERAPGQLLPAGFIRGYACAIAAVLLWPVLSRRSSRIPDEIEATAESDDRFIRTIARVWTVACLFLVALAFCVSGIGAFGAAGHMLGNLIADAS